MYVIDNIIYNSGSRTSAPLVKVNSTYMKSERVNLVAPAGLVDCLLY